MIAVATVNKVIINCHPFLSQNKIWFHYLQEKTQENIWAQFEKKSEMLIQINSFSRDPNTSIPSAASPNFVFQLFQYGFKQETETINYYKENFTIKNL